VVSDLNGYAAGKLRGWHTKKLERVTDVYFLFTNKMIWSMATRNETKRSCIPSERI